MKRILAIFMASIHFAWAKPLVENPKALAAIREEMGKGAPMELRALEIRAKIHEPTVIYILDRAKVEVNFKEEDVSFSERVFDPIVYNLF